MAVPEIGCRPDPPTAMIDCYTVQSWWHQDSGYEIWPPIGWPPPFVIGRSKYRLGLPDVTMHYGLEWLVGILTFFIGHWQSACTALTAGKCLPLGLYKETVKESTAMRITQWCWGEIQNAITFGANSSDNMTCISMNLMRDLTWVYICNLKN